jgi:hypothetical protein
MTQYVIRRLLLNVVVIWIVASFVFVAMRVDYAAQQVSTPFRQRAAAVSRAAAREAPARADDPADSVPQFLRDLVAEIWQVLPDERLP